MFGKILKKNLIDNDPLSNLSNIKDIQKNLKERDDIKSTRFDEVFITALLHFKEFLETNNKLNLKKSIEYLTEAITIKKNHAGSYFYLAFIAYLAEDIVLAKKYYEVTFLLDKNYPGLSTLKEKIFSN